jgi:hypothetical protein
VWQDNSVFFAEKFMDDVKNATETNRHKKTDCFLKTIGFFVSMAERQGFEPWEGINPQRFSRPPLSAAQPPLLTRRIIYAAAFIAIIILYLTLK